MKNLRIQLRNVLFYPHVVILSKGLSLLTEVQTQPRSQSSTTAIVACSTNNKLFVLQATRLVQTLVLIFGAKMEEVVIETCQYI